MGSGLLSPGRVLICLPSVFRRLYARFGAPFVYARFSQTSTREKKLVGEMPHSCINGRTVVGVSSAYARSVLLGGINELGLSPAAANCSRLASEGSVSRGRSRVSTFAFNRAKATL